MLPMNQSKFDLFPIDIHTFETCNEAVMAVKAYTHCQSTQAM